MTNRKTEDVLILAIKAVIYDDVTDADDKVETLDYLYDQLHYERANTRCGNITLGSLMDQEGEG